MGSFAGASWDNLTILFPVVILAFFFFWSQYRNLNLMLLGDEVSITLGTDLHRLRQIYLLVSAAVVGFVVSSSRYDWFCGPDYSPSGADDSLGQIIRKFCRSVHW